jgi:iron complex transport system ATP-binding protein
MLQATGITLRIRDRVILEDVSLAVSPAAFTAVVGPNGAGKSSLLKVLSGEHALTRGEISINGQALAAYGTRALSQVRAVMPQSATVHFAFSVEQIVMLGRHAHNTTNTENRQVVNEIMALTGLETFRHRNYMTLSGGEKQRVQLARVLAQVWEETLHPRYILLDEPTSSLDIAQQQHLFGLARMVCGRNIGVMAIVHDLNLAVQFADHLYFLKDGRVTASGIAQEVFTQANVENTFDCRVNIYRDAGNDCPYIIPKRETLNTQTQKLKISRP